LDKLYGNLSDWINRALWIGLIDIYPLDKLPQFIRRWKFIRNDNRL